MLCVNSPLDIANTYIYMWVITTSTIHKLSLTWHYGIAFKVFTFISSCFPWDLNQWHSAMLYCESCRNAITIIKNNALFTPSWSPSRHLRPQAEKTSWMKYLSSPSQVCNHIFFLKIYFWRCHKIDGCQLVKTWAVWPEAVGIIFSFFSRSVRLWHWAAQRFWAQEWKQESSGS